MKRRADGANQLAIGLRVGYWPCLRAPYVQVVFACWRIEIWFGLPSYLTALPPAMSAEVARIDGEIRRLTAYLAGRPG